MTCNQILDIQNMHTNAKNTPSIYKGSTQTCGHIRKRMNSHTNMHAMVCSPQPSCVRDELERSTLSCNANKRNHGSLPNVSQPKRRERWLRLQVPHAEPLTPSSSIFWQLHQLHARQKLTQTLRAPCPSPRLSTSFRQMLREWYPCYCNHEAGISTGRLAIVYNKAEGTLIILDQSSPTRRCSCLSAMKWP